MNRAAGITTTILGNLRADQPPPTPPACRENPCLYVDPDGNRIEPCNADTRLHLAPAAACPLAEAERAKRRRNGDSVSHGAGEFAAQDNS